MSGMSTPVHHLPATYSCTLPCMYQQWLSLAGMKSMPLFGLYAANGQSLPPQSDGQKSARLPVFGTRSGLYSGRPVVGSMLLKTFCLTYGVAETNAILSAERSSR